MRRMILVFQLGVFFLFLVAMPVQASLPNPPPVTNLSFLDDFSDPVFTANIWSASGSYSVGNSILTVQAEGSVNGGMNVMQTKGKFHYGTVVLNLSLPTNARAMALIGFSGTSAVGGARLIVFNYTTSSGNSWLTALVGTVYGSIECTGEPVSYCQQTQSMFISGVDMNAFNVFQIQWSQLSSTGNPQMIFTFHGFSVVINPATPITRDIDNYAMSIALGLFTDSSVPITLKADYVVKGDLPYPIPEFSTPLVIVIGAVAISLIFGKKYRKSG